jgi:hypothetical protein
MSPATVNGNSNAYPSANSSIDANGNTHSHSDTYTNEYSVSATARFESDSGLL